MLHGDGFPIAEALCSGSVLQGLKDRFAAIEVSLPNISYSGRGPDIIKTFSVMELTMILCTSIGRTSRFSWRGGSFAFILKAFQILIASGLLSLPELVDLGFVKHTVAAKVVFVDKAVIQQEGCRILGSMMGACTYNEGMLKTIVMAMLPHPRSMDVQEQGFRAVLAFVERFATIDARKEFIFNTAGESILAVMKENPTCKLILALGNKIISVLRTIPLLRMSFVNMGVLEIVLNSMRLNADSASEQEAGCFLLEEYARDTGSARLMGSKGWVCGCNFGSHATTPAKQGGAGVWLLGH